VRPKILLLYFEISIKGNREV